MYLSLIELPLITFLCIGLFGRSIGARGTIVLSVFSSIVCLLLSGIIFFKVAFCSNPCSLTVTSFFNSGLFNVNWGFLFDTLTAIMCLIVTLISSLVVIYSCSYMVEDPHFVRFISYLKLFTVSMLVLVTGDNLMQLFVGWELVGLASFLLITFWFTRKDANKAGLQAMLFNRVGDLGLALGIMTIFFAYKTVNYQSLFCLSYFDVNLVESCNILDFACILLFIGASGKSGQLILHAWLPNAMNAPTPVSALLHAATMVTAGIFLLARVSPLLDNAPLASNVVLFVGSATAFFAGSIGLFQNDFKSIIAYSTASQLGYMVAICGLSYYNVGIFHLFNHAFFKALLFLTAGAVIHALGNEQDIRKCGGLHQILIFSYTNLLIGTLALIGMPFLSGFYSKDIIIETSFCEFFYCGDVGYFLTLFSVFTTTFYSFRLLFMVFFYNMTPNVDRVYTNLHKQTAKKVEDTDWVMGFVLTTLSLGSIFVGSYLQPMFLGTASDFWNDSVSTEVNLDDFEYTSPIQKLIPLLGISFGILTAYFVVLIWNNQINYLQNGDRKWPEFLLKFNYLFLNDRWLYDKLVNDWFNFPLYSAGGRMTSLLDKGVLEFGLFGSMGISNALKELDLKLINSQSGLIYHYAIIVVISGLSFLMILCLDEQILILDHRITGIMVASLFLL